LNDSGHASVGARPGELPRSRLGLLALGALGVVYGDIGTSPLYALRECFHGPHQLNTLNEANVLGVLSLIVWSLIIVISIKYVVFILRADNRGEGGILALTALIVPGGASVDRTGKLIVMIGLFGAALLYADGMITPAITVLSAVEGLGVATEFFDEHPNYTIAIAVGILAVLFMAQSLGTAKVGNIFGPIILLWFLSLAILGIVEIVRHPGVLWAINPWYAAQFFWANGMAGFLIMGTVFLAVTGGEALYADIGHFGVPPVRYAWFAVVLPALVLNYFGQGAHLIADPSAAENPLFHMTPGWALYPMVALATAAAVIASQAIITGAFSLTLQAVQLGYSPRLTIEHTSSEQKGQIYLPAVNWVLAIACIVLVLEFRTSSNLAAAYGIAITMTMVITTILFYFFLRHKWKWNLPTSLALAGVFLVIDLAFFGANVPKIADGGWFPLAVAGAIFVLMTTWRRGRQILGARLRERLVPVDLFIAQLLCEPPHRVPGDAIFMTGNPVGTPPALRHNVAHNRILHERVIIVVVQTADVPHVPAGERSGVEEIGEGFWRVILTYGFMDQPNVPLALARLNEPTLKIRPDEVSYFLGHETILASGAPGMALWREKLFAWMSRNAQTATRYFHLPPDRVVEIGTQVEL
jgi:KUP system potassium uptake protein